MGLILLTNLACQAAEGKAAESAAQKVDWRKMMTIADPKHDAQGNLLPLQSYDETIRRGMSFLLKDHLKWFKGPPEALLDESGRTRMPWVYYSNLQHNGAPFPSSVDRFVSYPAFHHALTIRTFIGYWRYANDGRALEEAVNLADWNIAHSTPADWPYGNFPWSTFQEKKPGGFRDKSGLMPDKAAIMGLAYLQLHEAAHEARFLKAAEAIANTLAARQRPDGTWPFRVDPKTEAVIEEYTSSVIYAVRLFESLDKLNGNDRYRANRDKTWNWLVNGPIKNKDFRGFYEDITEGKNHLTNYDCLDTIRYLLANRTADNGYLEMAKDLNAWVEKVFLDKIKGFEPAEGIREQLACNVVMGIHSLNWASMLLDLANATGDEKLKQRAGQTANYITYYLQPDNRIVVGFEYPQWWYSCHAGVILYLLDFAAPAGQFTSGVSGARGCKLSRFTQTEPPCGLTMSIIEQREQPVIAKGMPGTEHNKYGFEGGCVLKLEGVYHLFTSEMVADPVHDKMMLAHWTSPDGLAWKRNDTIFESSASMDPKEIRSALWAPMPVYNEEEGRWNLFHVSFTKTDFGRIWRAVSSVKGRTGINGPWENPQVILEGDPEWEGIAGCHSIFPYPVNGKWMAFYGSADHRTWWSVGLLSSERLAGPWKRETALNPVTLSGELGTENPVVTRLKSGRYVAVFDTLKNQPQQGYGLDGNLIGYADSVDGVHWSAAKQLKVDIAKLWITDIRTPLGLVEEDDGTFTLFYTGFQRPAEGESSKGWKEYRNVGMLKIRLTVKKRIENEKRERAQP